MGPCISVLEMDQVWLQLEGSLLCARTAEKFAVVHGSEPLAKVHFDPMGPQSCDPCNLGAKIALARADFKEGGGILFRELVVVLGLTFQELDCCLVASVQL